MQMNLSTTLCWIFFLLLDGSLGSRIAKAAEPGYIPCREPDIGSRRFVEQQRIHGGKRAKRVRIVPLK